jgi:flavin-dependent dehydrogenase
MRDFDAIIIGGSLAGSTAAMQLAGRGWDVVVLEKSIFPRHKVCGEFLSPAIWPLADRLGMAEKILGAGGRRIEKAVFRLSSARNIKIPLAKPAEPRPFGYGISRKALDTLFLEEAKGRGADVRENQEVQHLSRERDSFIAHAFDFGRRELMHYRSKLVVNAAGRFHRFQETHAVPHAGQEIFQGAPSIPRRRGRTQRVCFKAHFDGPSLEERVELVFFDHGYIGMVNVEEGTVNLCGTVEASRLPEPSNFDRLLLEIARESIPFSHWLAEARRRSTWLVCGPQEHEFAGGYRNGLFHAGDAACSLEPFLGQGMALAMTGGWLVAEILGPREERRDLARCGKIYAHSLANLVSGKVVLGRALKFLARGAGTTLLSPFLPRLLRALVGRACAPPRGTLTARRSIWRAGDGPRQPTSTVREPAGTPR